MMASVRGCSVLSRASTMDKMARAPLRPIDPLTRVFGTDTRRFCRASDAFRDSGSWIEGSCAANCVALMETFSPGPCSS